MSKTRNRPQPNPQPDPPPSQSSPQPDPPPSPEAGSSVVVEDLAAPAAAAEDLAAIEREANQVLGGEGGAHDAPHVEKPVAPPLDPQRFANDAEFCVDFGLDFLSAQTGITYSPDTRARGAKRLTPLLAKYEGRWPPWLLAYKEEAAFLAWGTGVLWQSYKVIRANSPKKPPTGSAPPAAGGLGPDRSAETPTVADAAAKH